MKNYLLLAVAVLLLFSCSTNSKQEGIYVKDIHELNEAINNVNANKFLNAWYCT